MDTDDIVLITLMNNPSDMEIVRKEHWYRIPADHAPTHLTQAQYLTFYLTRTFGNAKWSIREYTPVRGHELVYRRELLPSQADHPRAENAYYKLQLGTLLVLPRPIVSRRGRRFLFIWTTGAKFSRAVEINDLLGKSDADDTLWEVLKDEHIGIERRSVAMDSRTRYRIDYWIPCVRGNLGVRIRCRQNLSPKIKGWRFLQYGEEDIHERQNRCLAEIRTMVRELGGAKYTLE